ncbi:MAG TPA: choice-of-anchor Q domain-containing protein [Gemmataceae bacterium]|nr:choice-of-anchor Q domain-containing protein [Gemmataceae bacterium]
MVFRRIWRSFLNQGQASEQRLPSRPRRSRLVVEVLEDRLVPTNWFVSTAGIDAAGRGGQTAPFRSIQFAVNQAVSGDRIHVATGTYDYNPAADVFGGTTLSGFLGVSAAVIVFDKSLQFFGGFDNAFTTRGLATVIEGHGTQRGMLVLAANTGVSLSMDGFTINNGVAHGQPALQGQDQTFAFGGGLWINAAAQQTASGPFTLSNMIFLNNSAIGDNTGGAGGAGAGGALELRFANAVNLTNITFSGNVAQGGTGTTKGGDADGAAIHADHATVTGNNLTFTSNRAVAGASNGSGLDSSGATADGLGGAVAVMSSSSGTLSNVTAVSNSATGGAAPAGRGGSAFGGAFFVESAALSLTAATVVGNTSTGGAGQTGGSGIGGGVAEINQSGNSSLTLDRVKVVSNTAQEGAASVTPGTAGGGGVYLTALVGAATGTINNSLIADNLATSSPGSASASGGGGGIWLQGVTATINQSTIANNRLGPGLIFGQAIVMLDISASQGTNATLSYSIIANHTTTNPQSSAISIGQFLQAGGNNHLTYNTNLFANNTQNDNSAGGAAGTVSGAATNLQAADAGFVSAGAPNNDYRLVAGSPAVNAATGSNATVDLNNFPRDAQPDIGAFELGSTPSSPPPPPPPPPSGGVARSSPGVFDPTTGTWYLRNETSAGGPDAGQFAYGAPGWVPVVGDWNSDGISTVGVFDPGTATWYLRNSNSPGAPDIGPFAFGGAGWKPVVGDWDGNGTWTIGVVDPNGVWYLRNSNTPGAPDITPFAYGAGGWTPVAGRWNGASFGIGVFDQTTGTWYLRNTPSPGAPDAGQFAYGGAGWQAVVGDWNNDGRTTIGVFDPNGTWYLRNSNTGGGPEVALFAYGAGNWLPVAGDYDGLPAIAAARSLGNALTATPPEDVLDTLFGQP